MTGVLAEIGEIGGAGLINAQGPCAAAAAPAVPLPGDDRAGVAIRPGQVVVGEIPHQAITWSPALKKLRKEWLDTEEKTDEELGCR